MFSTCAWCHATSARRDVCFEGFCKMEMLGRRNCSLMSFILSEKSVIGCSIMFSLKFSSQQSFSKRTLRPQEYQFYHSLLNHNFSAVVCVIANHLNTLVEKPTVAETITTKNARGELPCVLLVQKILAGFCREYFWYKKCSRGFAVRTFDTGNARGELPCVLSTPKMLAEFIRAYFRNQKCSRNLSPRTSDTKSVRGIYPFSSQQSFS